MPIAKTFPKPRPTPIVTDSNVLEAGTKDAAPAKRGRELGEPSDPIDEAPTEAATPILDDKGWTAEEWVDSSVSSGMEEFMRKAGTVEQPEQLTPVAASQPRADMIMAGRKNACSPAKLRRVGGEEADRGEEEKEDEDMQPKATEEKKRNAGIGGVEDREGEEEVSPTLTFPPAQRSLKGTAGKGKEGGGGAWEPEVAWEAEEEAFTGGLEVGEGRGGVEARQEEDEEDGQGGNETPPCLY